MLEDDLRLTEFLDDQVDRHSDEDGDEETRACHEDHTSVGLRILLGDLLLFVRNLNVDGDYVCDRLNFLGVARALAFRALLGWLEMVFMNLPIHATL